MPAAQAVYGYGSSDTSWQEKKNTVQTTDRVIVTDIFDFIRSGAGRDMISINIPRNDMKELIVVIAINTAVVEGILKDHRDKMASIDVLGLEGTIAFGKSMVDMLSLVAGFTQQELVDELRKFTSSTQTELAKKMKVHFNKSNENIDSFVIRMFGNEGT
jgi:hypothetical protein